MGINLIGLLVAKEYNELERLFKECPIKFNESPDNEEVIDASLWLSRLKKTNDTLPADLKSRIMGMDISRSLYDYLGQVSSYYNLSPVELLVGIRYNSNLKGHMNKLSLYLGLRDENTLGNLADHLFIEDPYVNLSVEELGLIYRAGNVPAEIVEKRFERKTQIQSVEIDDSIEKFNARLASHQGIHTDTNKDLFTYVGHSFVPGGIFHQFMEEYRKYNTYIFEKLKENNIKMLKNTTQIIKFTRREPQPCGKGVLHKLFCTYQKP